MATCARIAATRAIENRDCRGPDGGAVNGATSFDVKNTGTGQGAANTFDGAEIVEGTVARLRAGRQVLRRPQRKVTEVSATKTSK